MPPGVWGLDLAVAAATLLAAGLIRGFSGFGSAMINAPVLSLLWGPTIGVPVAALVEFVPAIQLTPRAIPDALWRTVWLMGVPALILIPAGAFLLITLPSDLTRRVVASIVLILVATLVLRANMIGYFTIVLLGMAVTFALHGLFTPIVLWRTGFLVVPFIVGIFVGARLFPYAAERTFRNIALTVLA